MPAPQFRNYVFTCYCCNANYKETGKPGPNETGPKLNDKIQYLAFGDEVCPTTLRHHWQGFLVMKKKCAKSTAQKALGCPCFMDGMKGNLAQNEKYCSEDGKYVEFGEKPNPGERTDLTQFSQGILRGEITLNDVLENNPGAYHTWGRTLIATQDLVWSRTQRSEMTTLIWIYGPPGTGKSHYVDEKEKSLYRKSVEKGEGKWWDGYNGEEAVLLEDFRGSKDIPYSSILRMCDRYPFDVSRRNRGPRPFISKRVYITSPVHPKDLYKNLHESDSLGQLYRRMGCECATFCDCKVLHFLVKYRKPAAAPSVPDIVVLD